MSITCTTPFATSTLGTITLALFTKTDPSSIVIVTFLPATVGIDSLVKSVEYPTVPFMTWYSRMLASWAVLRLPTAEPIAWKAALEGAKMVTSCRLSTVLARLVCMRAPTRAVTGLRVSA